MYVDNNTTIIDNNISEILDIIEVILIIIL